MSRRSVLRAVFLGMGAASLPSWVLKTAVAHAQASGGPELTIPLGPLAAQDYGPLVLKTVTDHLSGVSHQLYAPADFDVRLVMRANVNPVTLDATAPLGHINPDGGAVYPQEDGGWIYVSNSEINPNGSVSALRFDNTGAVIDYYRICTGTRQNCAGGQTPWGTWITCEEVTGGYCYECDPKGVTPQRRLDALGARNGREAVAIDPRNNVIYQTLDSSTGKLVRFVSDPSDLTVLPNGVTRMGLVTGVSQRLFIPAFNGMPEYNNAVVPNDATGNSRLRQARPIQWVADTGTNGTNFTGGEGIWYYEVPEALRTIPSAGSVPTRGVMFFASKNDNRIWAIDIENNLIELIYDTFNGQSFTNLRNAGGTPSEFSQVDNVNVSPTGDVLVAEDGTAMRLAIMLNNQPAKLLMQITRGDSEITGPAFTVDGSRLYFSSQRGRSGATGTAINGATYEMTIPPRFRSIQRPNAFPFYEGENLPAIPDETVTSEPIVIGGFLGPLTVTISSGNDAQFSIDDGEWTTGPATITAGQSLRVRHKSASTTSTLTTTTLTIGLPNGVGAVSQTFQTLTADPLPAPALETLGAVALGAALVAAGAAQVEAKDA